MASSRRAGLNETITTFGPGKQQTSVSTWENDTTLNLASLQVSHGLECYGDGSPYSQRVTVAGATTSADYYRRIFAAEGHRHNGNPNAGVIFSSTADDSVFTSSENHFSIQDIVASLQINSTTTRYCFNTGTGLTGIRYVGCIAYNSNNSGSGQARGFQDVTLGAEYINCGAIKLESIGIRIGSTGGAPTRLRNFTVAGCGINAYLVASGAVAILENCLAHASGTNFSNSGTITGSQYNASSDGTVFGTTGVRTNQTFRFANAGADDYRLAGNDLGARNRGVDLSANFDDDVAWALRDLWSIGYHEPQIDLALGRGITSIIAIHDVGI